MHHTTFSVCAAHQRWVLLNPSRQSAVGIGPSIFHSVRHTAFTGHATPVGRELLNPILDLKKECHYFVPDTLPPSPEGAAQHECTATFNVQFSIPICASQPGFVPLNVILHSPMTISTPLAHLSHHISNTLFPGGAPLFPLN